MLSTLCVWLGPGRNTPSSCVVMHGYNEGGGCWQTPPPPTKAHFQCRFIDIFNRCDYSCSWYFCRQYCAIKVFLRNSVSSRCNRLNDSLTNEMLHFISFRNFYVENSEHIVWMRDSSGQQQAATLYCEAPGWKDPARSSFPVVRQLWSRHNYSIVVAIFFSFLLHVYTRFFTSYYARYRVHTRYDRKLS